MEAKKDRNSIKESMQPLSGIVRTTDDYIIDDKEAGFDRLSMIVEFVATVADLRNYKINNILE
ncbi:hypothetical protein [Marivirga lumbricoides]